MKSTLLLIIGLLWLHSATAATLSTNTMSPLSAIAGLANTNWVDYPLSSGNSGGGHITLIEMASQATGWIPGAYSLYGARFAAGASGAITWSIPSAQLAAGTNVQIMAGLITSNSFDMAMYARCSTMTIASPPVATYVGSSTYTNTSPAGTSFWYFQTNFTIPSTNRIGSISFGTGGNAYMFYLGSFRVRIY